MAGPELWLAQLSAWMMGVVQAYGYPGVFLINLLGSATIFLPVPAFAITFALGAVLNPWLLGLVAALGSALGEFTGYVLGFGSHEALKKRYKGWLKRVKQLSEKRGMFAALVIIAFTPIPTDLGGIIAGMAKYDAKRFFLAMFIGKAMLYTLLALAGFYGIGWILQLFGLG